LSQIINLPVRDSMTGARLGRASDLVATLRETYPIVTGLVMKFRGARGRYYLPWDNVRKLAARKSIEVDKLPRLLERDFESGNEILLRDSFLDRQVVDISGAKVVRVNDLHLLKEQSKLWVVHMDVGFKGLLRRLGWLKPYNSIFKWLFSYELRDKLIAWRYVQPITPATVSQSLQLKVDHAKVSELLPADLSDILEDLGVDEREALFDSLDDSIAAGTLQELPLKIRIQMAESLSQARLARIINEMPTDEVVDLLAKLNKKLVNSLFKLLPSDKVTQIKDLLKHSEDLAGAIMNPQFIVTSPGATAGDVIARIKKEADETESLHYVYVVEDNGALIGVITLRQLLTTDLDQRVSEFMRKRPVKVHVDTDVKEVAQIFSKYDFDLVPVVDKKNKILGIITMKDAFESVYSKIGVKD
jgi:CBS domain-containing protein/sporulation protein YlmC with PRC-barrel domain